MKPGISNIFSLKEAIQLPGFDTIIVGAGVLGLWAARHAIREGRSVLVLEKRQVCSGASGGFLGALMPHVPDGWNTKKAFQFDALDRLENEIAELEADTGHDCGYRRCGHIMPLVHEDMISHAERRIAGAEQNWQGRYSMRLLDPSHDQIVNQGWPGAQVASFGALQDSFAARVSPRNLVEALAIYTKSRGELRQGVGVQEIDAERSEVVLEDGSRISSGEIIVANGYEAYPLLQAYLARVNDDKSIGRGDKGQAVLVEYAHNDDLPIVYFDGSYLVPHANNRVAIGSTSIRHWSGRPGEFDSKDMAFYEKALKLVPGLKNAPIVERWAGVRPRNTLKGRGTGPWFGAVPDFPNLIALIGGYKITFGIAHVAMQVARGEIEGPVKPKPNSE